MKNVLKFGISICLLFLVFSLSAQEEREITEEYPELKLPITQARSLDVASEVEIEVDCSHFKARTGVVTIKWNQQQRSLATYRLDLSVHKQGFENELFATVWPIQYGKQSQLYNRQRYTNAALTRGLQLRTTEVSPSRGESTPMVKLEGLEPGLNYYWRILKRDDQGWTLAGMIRIEAPTCPVDFIKN